MSDERVGGAAARDRSRRGLLVMNPKATTASESTRDVLVGALSSRLDLRTVTTRNRGHAADLAREAVGDGTDVVIAFGGDGTVNEVVAGLMDGGPRPDAPALAVVPGGSTNVFARALGLPNHAVEATGVLLRLLREDKTRRVSLGAARADGDDADRYFTFCAGYGFDAAVVGEVERQRAGGHRSTNSLYLRSAFGEYFRRTDRKAAPIVAQLPDGAEVPPMFMAVLANTAPWTYLGSRPILATPQAAFDTGLDLFGMARMGAYAVGRTASRLVSGSDRIGRGAWEVVRHDLPHITLTAQRPVAFQVDGEYLGPRERVTFRSVPDALKVFA